jgi:hypothetical protein
LKPVPEILKKLEQNIQLEQGIDGFRVVFRRSHGLVYVVIASWGMGWEHVSVSIPQQQRCPIWSEMCYIKSLFWNDDETVIQYHPAKQDYVNFHPFVLHLWKPIGIELPKPPSIMIGPKND